MKKIKKISIIGAICFLSAALLPAQSDLQTVATVNLTKTVAISVKQLKEKAAEIEKNADARNDIRATLRKELGREPTESEITIRIRREILDTMINDALLTQAAERDNIRVTDNEVNQTIEQIRTDLQQYMGRRPTDDEFNEALKQQTGGMDLPTFREQQKKEMLLARYITAKKGDPAELLKAKIQPVTDDDVAKEYELQKRQISQDKTLLFAAIFFPYERDADKAKAKAAADKVAKEIGGSVAKFDEKLRVRSTDYRVTPNGVIQHNKAAQNQVGQAFLDAAFALKYDGKTGMTSVSKVLEVPQGDAKGFYIIKPTGYYPEKMPLALDDVWLQYNATVREVLRAALTRERQQRALLELQDELVKDLRKGNPYKILENNLNYDLK